MLPHIHGEQRLLTVRQRCIGVGGTDDFQRAGIVNQPRPTAAEAAHGRLLELFLQFVEAAERRVDRVGDRARQRTGKQLVAGAEALTLCSIETPQLA